MGVSQNCGSLEPWLASLKFPEGPAGAARSLHAAIREYPKIADFPKELPIFWRAGHDRC